MSEALFEPVMPIGEALQQAATFAVPVQDEPDGGWLVSDLVDVTQIDPTLKLDVRYATPNNFMGGPVYDVAAAVLHRPVAEDLARVSSELKHAGYGIVVYDAYRPFYVTVAMWLVTPEHLREDFVAKPHRGSIHNRGAAVDIGLYHLDTGQPAEMPSDYDEFTERAAFDYDQGPQAPRQRRDLLIKCMADHGFRVYKAEWWHFNHPDAKRYQLNNTPLRDIVKPLEE